MKFVYILTNRTNDTLYVGMTNHLLRRIYEHKEHVLPTSHTTKYNQTKLVYYEVFDNILAAIAREKQLKKWNHELKRMLITKFNPHWADLYNEIASTYPHT